MVQTKKEVILLIYPKTGYELFHTQAPPHGLLAIATHLEKNGFKVVILDQRIDEQFNSKLKKNVEQALFVGISSMTGTQLKFAIGISKRIKNQRKDLTIVWGGIHPTMKPLEVIKNNFVDIAAIGEGEITFVKIANAIKKDEKLNKIKGVAFRNNDKIVINKQDELLSPKEFLPTPWHLVNIEKYVNQYTKNKKIIRELDIGTTSKGCPAKCYFCYNMPVNKAKWRGIDAIEVVNRIVQVIKKYQINSIILRDDDFFADIKRVETICDKIIKLKLNIQWYAAGIRINQFKDISDESLLLIKKSGCTSFRFGAESGSSKVLKEMNKEIEPQDTIDANNRCKKIGITPHYSFMIGFPRETIADILQTVDLVDKLKKDNPKAVIHGINLLTPYPGTMIYNLMKREGLKEPTKTEDWLNFHHLSLVTTHFTKQEKKEIKNINELSYMTSEIAYNSLKPILKPMAWIFVKWANFRWKHRLFRFAPEIYVMRVFRNMILGM